MLSPHPHQINSFLMLLLNVEEDTGKCICSRILGRCVQQYNFSELEYVLKP